MLKDFSPIDSVVLSHIEKGFFPSAVISVFDHEKTLYQKAYGENLMPDGTVQKADTDTAYDMASCTKIATSTQILLLMEEGRLKLTTRIPEVLPEVKEYPDLYGRLRSVTMYQLLTHTSGILDWFPFYTIKTHTDPDEGAKDFLWAFNTFIAKIPIIDGMVYSDMNFMLLGLIVSRLKGKPLSACLDDLKALLGAKRLGYLLEKTEDNMAPSCYDNAIEERMVKERGLHFDAWREHGRPIIGCNDGNTHYFFGGVAGLAGIAANADAYERLGRLYLNTTKPHLIQSMDMAEDGRGLGWQIDEKLYPEGCGHTGFSGPSIWISRKLDIGVIALTNRLAFPTEHGTNTQDFRRALAAKVMEIIR